MSATQFITAVVAVATGALIFVLGQMGLKIIIEPYLEQQKVITDIVHALIYFGNAYCTNFEDDENKVLNERINEAIQKYRALAGQLVSTNRFIRWRGFWQYFLFAPNMEEVKEAASALIVLSNSLRNPAGPDIRLQSRERVIIALRIHTLE